MLFTKYFELCFSLLFDAFNTLFNNERRQSNLDTVGDLPWGFPSVRSEILAIYSLQLTRDWNEVFDSF